MSTLVEEIGGYSFDGSSRSRSRDRSQSAQKHQKSVSRKKGISESHRSVRSEAQSRSKSKSVKSKLQSLKASRRKSSLDSGYDIVSNSGSEDLSMPYREQRSERSPKYLFCRSRARRVTYAKSTHIKGVPPVLRISAYMHGHSHPELAKKLIDKIPKTVDEMCERERERVRAFIRGETVADTTEVIRSPRWEKSAGFTPLTKTPKDILAMDNVKFPPPPPMHIEEAVASGRLAHLVKDIRQSGQKSKGSAKGKEKVTSMALGSEGYMLMVVALQRLCMSIVSGILAIGRVVKSPSLYNALLGRTGMRSLGAVASTIHLMIKFPTSNGIATIATTRDTLKECRQIKEAQALSRHSRVTDPSLMQTSSKVTNPRVLLALVETRSRRPGKNVNIFAWTPADMTGIPRAITEHSLDTYLYIEPKVQKKRSRAKDRRKVVTDEFNKWIKVGIVRRVRYPSWVSNPVLVKKVDGSWRMCIDFKDLNKACPKDLYPLSEIDWKIESLMGFQYKCFLDAYKGCHQIHMIKKGDEKTAFCTEDGVLCYTKMPFGLKNAGRHIKGWIIMKLNPKKYLFGMEEGKFLGYIVTSEGIMDNPEKQRLSWTCPHQGLLTNEAVSAMLPTKRYGKKMPIHYVSRSLQGAKTNYAPMEKLALALVYAARRLRRYFQAHPIKVITDSPIEKVLNKSRASGRASNNEGSRAGLILIARDDVEYSYALRLNFSNSNNDAEYEALLAGLRIATEMQVKNIHAFVDSKLVASQVKGSYEAKGERMIKYQEKVLELAGAFNRQVLAKAMNLGYYWPSMHRDASELIRACDDCQAHASVPRLPKTDMISITSSWPFMKWGYGHSRTSLGGSRKGDGNGAVERENRSLLREIKTRLEKERSAWAEEELRLDPMEERREIVVIREARYKQQVEKYYNKKVRHVQFKVGEFVLRKNEASRAANTGKLGPTWEGPYKVIQVFQSRAYKLSNMEGEEIPRTWHACNLRR
nr:hypothetical protein [Tanacetum cinerariifolium]